VWIVGFILLLVAVLIFAFVKRITINQPFPKQISASLSPPALFQTDSISGVVVDAQNHPVAGATVRIKTTTQATETDSNGRFTLSNLPPGQPVLLTAWAAGYYIGGGKQATMPGREDIRITLAAHSQLDNPQYDWLSAYSAAGYPGSGEDGNCENCHADGINTALPFPEWQGDAHALSPQNPRFLSMYEGTDLLGNSSPATTFFNNPDYGRVPLRPDLSRPYYGPGYKLDFPGTTGNCAACHAPAAAVNQPYGIDPTVVSGVGSEGITCDFCHKVWDVNLDPQSGLPYPNMPGVLSFEFLRPASGHQFFAGPYDDVAPGEDTYTPIQRQSQFCAPCHYGIFWNTVVYNSFGEWLESPYSDVTRAQIAGLPSVKSCQDCHMPSGKTNLIAAVGKGGLTRDPQTIFSHRMPGGMDKSLLENSLTMTVTSQLEKEKLVVEVTLFNDQTGHHIPTDSPLRQLILLVDAKDGESQALSLIDGPTLPDWTGVGDPSNGYYAGLPGKAYAKVLSELWTEILPSGAYWNHTQILSDNRLAAFAQDKTRFVFSAPTQGEGRVSISLLYRRAYKQLMDWKNWDVPDIQIEHQVIEMTSFSYQSSK
jgi:hypothetical protein